MLIKFLALGFVVYFTNAWCWLDFVIVMVSDTLFQLLIKKKLILMKDDTPKILPKIFNQKKYSFFKNIFNTN